jgi:hypothetical protein
VREPKRRDRLELQQAIEAVLAEEFEGEGFELFPAQARFIAERITQVVLQQQSERA